jgi:glutamate-1-semialdehyde 2,1-aminomutase
MRYFKRSEAHLRRAESTIPLGSQTFSKSRTQYPVGISPLYIDKAKGPYVWDLDGNKYIDLVNSLASVTLGYGDKQVSKAVRKQLKKGVSFSLPGMLEVEVAELLVEMIPCAEKVRFGKNGTDATSAAIRLSRAHTNKRVIAVCGYHGWQDWYIGSTTRNKGVPNEVSELTKTFVFNDIDSLQSIFNAHPNDVAAVILEPMNASYPKPRFLEDVRDLTKSNDAILIFDETITGFRYAPGGAQELLGVIPDLATFGKGMANGFPLSAVVGKAEIMNEMEEIFFSGTFGGELLSLAAAKVVLSRIKSEKITEKLSEIGHSLRREVDSIITKYELQKVLSLTGHDTWIFLNWNIQDEALRAQAKTYFMQEMFQQGVLILATHNVSLALGEREIKKIVAAYDSVLKGLSEALLDASLTTKIRVEPLKPLFKIR